MRRMRPATGAVSILIYLPLESNTTIIISLSLFILWSYAPFVQ